MASPRHLHWLPRLDEPDEALRSLARISDPGARLAQIAHIAQHQLDFIRTGKLDRLLEKTRGELETTAGLSPLKLAWLCSSTVDHQLPATRIAGLRRGLLITSYITPYNQYRQALLDPDSPLARFAPQAVLFGIDHSELLPTLPLSASRASVQQAIEPRIDDLRRLWAEARERFKCVVIQQIAPDLSPSLLGSFDRLVPGAPAMLVHALNRAIADAAAADRVLLLDLEAACGHLGKETWFDPVRWHHGKQLISPVVTPLYGDLVGRILAAARGLSRKCLVLDLDNTLWGGVLGDDGPSSLILGQGSAVGEAFVSFQRYARELKERGILLAVCSKNNLDTAEAVFRSHPEMVLKRDDIAVFIANWDDKATNLRKIAAALNIGLDALVFFDDNPAERALVRQHLPMVAVPEVPEAPALYARCIADAGYFEATALSAEDVQRAQQYIDNARREELRHTSTPDLGAYLTSLKMEMQVGHFEDADLPRVTQLINKTNQFNLTTRRYAEAEVRELRDNPRSICLHFRLKDAFGDNGIISVMIARPATAAEGEATFVIDTWLMSCRVLGRGVEAAALATLCRAIAARGGSTLLGDYLPTPKNGLVREHYPKLGFQEIPADSPAKGATRWSLSLGSFAPPPVHIVTRGTPD